ncbi:12656_t:CDS:2, partial [Gigaspora margarita]
LIGNRSLALRVQEYLGTIVRVYREKGFKNPVEDFRMRKVIMGMRLVRAQGEEADCGFGRNLVLVALGFRTMRKLEELDC